MRTAATLALVMDFVLGAFGSGAFAAPAKKSGPMAPPDSERIDVTAVKDKLKVLSDGKGHFVALIPFGPYDHAFYGDGKTFYQLRVGSSGASGTESYDFTFWEPRVKAAYQASFSFREGSHTLLCGDRKTTFTPLPDAEQTTAIAAAGFFKPLWKHQAYALARDDRGTYYYVDKQREPEENRAFRLFRGPRGQLVNLKMTNVVSDSEGEIFATPTGQLRLILDKKETVWVKGKARTPLTALPIWENAPLIYTDLGAYTGQRLGTPCDDL